MNEEAAFLQAMLETPNDLVLRMVFADWLEERADPRGELLRLTDALTQSLDLPRRGELEARLHALVDEGIQAIGPFWTNSIGMRFVWIPPGKFLMGSLPTEDSRFDDEAPHPVTLTRGFYLGVHQVTQDQWEAVTDKNPSHFKGNQLPVDTVSWKLCNQFCKALRKRDKQKYRLPTEAEWEYACRGGTSAAYCYGNNRRKLGTHAWCWENAGQTHPVGKKKANAWGLYDMHGNVWEWCKDGYSLYPTAETTDPEGIAADNALILRGGSWLNMSSFVRCATRRRFDASWLATFSQPGHPGNHNVGVRVCFHLD